MSEFINNLLSLSKLEVLSDIHGALSMLALFLFGASFALYFSLNKFASAIKWLKGVLILLAFNLIALDAFGLIIYAPYRGKNGPKEALISLESTAWIHKTLFEHKEFLAFAPMLIIITTAIVVWKYGSKLTSDKQMKRFVLFSLIASVIFVAVVAAEAVIITKAAPLR